MPTQNSEGTFKLAVSVVTFLVLWQLLASRYHAYTFPTFPELLSTMYTVYTGGGSYSLLDHVPVTFARIGLVFSVAVPLGLAVGIGMGRHWFVESYFSPYILVSLAFPSIVWAFLCVIWFGLTEYLVPVTVGVLITTPYVVINMWEGTKDLDTDILDMAESFGSGRREVWRFIIVPFLLPYIFAMLRVVLAVGWKVMLVAEIFGTQSGVGFVIDQFFTQQRTDLILVWVLPVMIAVFAVERALKRLEERMFVWRPESDTQIDAQLGGA